MTRANAVSIQAVLRVIGIALFTAVGPLAYAHHSAAMFDRKVTLTLNGTVKRFDYVNPHSWLYVDVSNADGTTTEWGFELDAPPRLRRIGVSPNFWQPGDSIKLKTNPLVDGRPAGLLAGAVSAAGKQFGEVSGLVP